jgi:hypothetical protein
VGAKLKGLDRRLKELFEELIEEIGPKNKKGRYAP